MKKLTPFLFLISLLCILMFVSCGGGEQYVEEKISFNTSFIQLNKGETSTLTVITNQNSGTVLDVVWSSNNTSVATVDNGLIRAVGAGNAIISATTQKGYQAICNVTVKENASTEWSVYLDASELTLYIGQIKHLTATLVPENVNQTVEWISSDPSVASVQNGEIEAKSLGTATISATVNGKSASCTVEVIKKDVSVSSVTLNYTRLVLQSGKYDKLTARVIPANADNANITWSTSDGGIVSVTDDGIVKALRAGIAVVTATAENGKSVSCTVEVKKNDDDGIYYTRVNDSGVADPTGSHVLFGSYPQSDVTDQNVISKLNDIAGELPENGDNKEWRSYKYYNGGSNETDFMWYTDQIYGGEKYRGVYFDQYRWMTTTDFTGDTNTLGGEYTYGGTQLGAGYEKGTVYWFKYEPIKWQILSEFNGAATIICEMILDSGAFHSVPGEVASHNYMYSEIREWLNNEFYNNAFDELQKEIILLTGIDNSMNSTGNGYSCENTEDFVWLLSHNESLSYYVNKEGSSYAKCQGLGDIGWWTRSPHKDSNGAHVHVVGWESIVDTRVTYAGVCPVIKIILDNL